MTGLDDAPLPDSHWWLEDPELWPLLAFEGGADGHGRPVDATWTDRQQVLEDLIRRPGPVDIDFARCLLVQETHSHGHAWGFRHGIELAAILVAEHRQVQDVWLTSDSLRRSSRRRSRWGWSLSVACRRVHSTPALYRSWWGMMPQVSKLR
ncbi:hypothetical protein ACFYOK_00230 [Microbispora bryophytorum]|uniref:hypothetical protein n=1 Tax=Microbispora bryophytorum TaxID=1460882 RepID=UPI0033FBAF19